MPTISARCLVRNEARSRTHVATVAPNDADLHAVELAIGAMARRESEDVLQPQFIPDSLRRGRDGLIRGHDNRVAAGGLRDSDESRIVQLLQAPAPEWSVLHSDRVDQR